MMSSTKELLASSDPTEATKYNAELLGVQKFADLLEISSAHISNVTNGNRKPGKVLKKALADAGLIPPPLPRHRIEARLRSQGQHDVLMRGVKAMGYDGWYDFVQLLADSWLETEKSDSGHRLIVVAGACNKGDIDCLCWHHHGKTHIPGAGIPGAPPYHDGCTCYMVKKAIPYGYIKLSRMLRRRNDDSKHYSS